MSRTVVAMSLLAAMACNRKDPVIGAEPSNIERGTTKMSNLLPADITQIISSCLHEETLWLVSGTQHLYQLTGTGIHRIPVRFGNQEVSVFRVAAGSKSLLLIAEDSSGQNILLRRTRDGAVKEVHLDREPRFVAEVQDNGLQYIGTDTRLRIRVGETETEDTEERYGLMLSSKGLIAVQAIETNTVRVGNGVAWRDRGRVTGTVVDVRADGALLVLNQGVWRKGDKAPLAELFLSRLVDGHETVISISSGAIRHAAFTHDGGVAVFEEQGGRVGFRVHPLK